MDPREHPPVAVLSSQLQNVNSDGDDDPLLDIARLFSGASLAWFPYISIDMSFTVPGSSRVITDLNDDCCLALFDRITLQKQLPLRSLTRQWNTLIEEKCRRKRSLKLFGSLDDVQSYSRKLIKYNFSEDTQFKLKPIGEDDDFIGTIEQLQGCAHLFPNIESFLYHGASKFMLDLEELSKMFPRLTSLTISNNFKCFKSIGKKVNNMNELSSENNSFQLVCAMHVPQLFNFNPLQHLTSLHLIGLEICKFPDEIPILLQLEEFSFCGYSAYNARELLFKLKAPNLKRLKIFNVLLYIDDLQTWSNSNLDMFSNLTAFSVGLENDDLEKEDIRDLINLITSKMTNLTFLQLRLLYVNLKFLKSLTKLRFLVDLHLSSIIWDFPAVIPRYLPQQLLLKNLHLSFIWENTADLVLYGVDEDEVVNLTDINFFNFQRIFPNVQQIFVSEKKADTLEWARQYMAQEQYSCPVTFTLEQSEWPLMGHHLKAYQELQKALGEKMELMMTNFWIHHNEYAGIAELFGDDAE